MNRTATLVKHGGAPILRYKGNAIRFELDGHPEDEDSILRAEVEDVRLAKEVADAHFRVELEEIHSHDDDDADADDGDGGDEEADTDDGGGNVPSLAEAREDYRKAQSLAKEMDVSASGTHGEILARIEDETEGEQ